MEKLLILANNDMGLYKFRKELIEELLRDYEVYICVPNGEYIVDLKEMGCKFIDVSIDRRGTNPLSDLKLMMNYFKIIKKMKPHIVLTYTIKPNIYGGLACRLNKVPQIANITGLGSVFEKKSALQKITVLLYKLALKNAFCVFFQNQQNKGAFEKLGIKSKKARLIPGSGVNLKQYKLLNYPSGNNINFLYISRIMKEKGIEDLLEAAKIIKGKYKNVFFHIIGPCEDKNYERIIQLNKETVVYHGIQNDIIPYLEQSHCTIHPSYYPEGISNVLLESAASGRPLITTNRTGCREVVEDNYNGYLFTEKNTEELISKIEVFIALEHNDKVKLGLNGRQKVEAEFDRKLVIDAYAKEIGNALAATGR